MLLRNSHLVLHPLKTPEELKRAFGALKFHLITLTTLKKRHGEGPHRGDLEAKTALPAMQCGYSRGKPLQITVRPAFLSSGHEGFLLLMHPASKATCLHAHSAAPA